MNEIKCPNAEKLFWRRLSPRARRALKSTVIVLVSLGLLDVASVVSFSLWQPPAPANVDAVIVLGAKVGTPALKARALDGYAVYQAGKTDTLVLSGAKGPDEPVSEAQAMADVINTAAARDHRQPHLILEIRSADTFQNIANAKRLVPKASSVIIVSDGYHLARSVAIAKHDGFRRVYWHSPQPTYYSRLDLVHYYLREAIAIVVYAPRLL